MLREVLRKSNTIMPLMYSYYIRIYEGKTISFFIGMVSYNQYHHIFLDKQI